ncbi:MAG TPA: ATP phosphoribosyltransferase [bacterium]|nr:ATP phosphoribosyltransferase [bacterium]
MNKKRLKFGFPLGVWYEDTIELFRTAGYKVCHDEKFQKIVLDDAEIQCIPARPIPMASFIEKGFLDAGISTEASLLEARAKLRRICDLEFIRPLPSKTKVVLAVPKNSNIRSISDLQGKKIITKIPNIAKDFLKRKKVSAKIIYSDTLLNEPLVGLVVDAIIDFAKTGDYLKAYRLRVLHTLLESSVVLVANKKCLKDRWKREKIEGLGYLLKGARLGQEMVGLMLQASDKMMEKVLRIVPSLKKPTVTQLRGENWFDVLTVVPKKEIREIIPKLKRNGCRAIIEFPLNKVVL